jgi:hypothetical protein
VNTTVKRILKILAIGIGIITGSAVVILIAAIAYFRIAFGPFPNCDEDSPAVALARSLSEKRLLKLNEDMKKIRWSEVGAVTFLDGDQIPIEFRDLNPKKIRPGRITLEGCMDHFVFLHFRNFKDGKSKIELTWGERPPDAGSQILLEK